MSIPEPYLPHLKLEQLHEACGEDLEFEKELLQTFEEQFNSSYAKLKTALEIKNQKDSILYSHDIKGAAKNIGAEEVGRIGFILEEASKSSNYDKASSHMDELQDAFKKLLESFKSYTSSIESK